MDRKIIEDDLQEIFTRDVKWPMLENKTILLCM